MLILLPTISDRFVSFTVENDGKQIPVNEWAFLPLGGCSKIVGWIQSGHDDVIQEDYTVHVGVDTVASISDDIAADLCLPKPASVVMHIRNEGLITQPNFKFSYEWQKDGRARPIAGAERIGCFIRIGSVYYRLPHQIYKIAKGIDRIKSILASNVQDRLLAWNEIEKYLPSETSRSITVDGFLSSTKVYLASAFELTVQQSIDGIDFDPVLLSTKKKEDIEYDDSIDFEKLLTPVDQEKFALLFKNNTECRSNYTLGVGKYLIFSEQLHKSLTIVHRIKNSSLETKLDFLKNPRAALSDAGISDGILDKIFSERIEGYGERRIKVIPWIKIEGQDWLPSEDSPRGLQIGQERLELNASECAILENKLAEAIKNQITSVDYKNLQIPANTETLISVGQLFPIKPNKNNDVIKDEKHQQPNIVKKCVLYVKDNLTDVKYKLKTEPRDEVPPFECTPLRLKSALDPHQLDGLRWMIDNYRAGVGGILLADDMGLGKTLQSLTFLAWLRENIMKLNVPNRPILIVAPTGLLNNWQEEHNKHLHEPGLGDLISAYGNNLNNLRENSNVKMLVKPLNTQKLKEANWILTTYETLSNYQTSFAGVHYAAVIFDEMQKIKTPNTGVTEAAQTLNSDFIIGMTGTPIETRLADIWCLIDTLQPGRLGTLREFSEKYERDHSATGELKQEISTSSNSVPPLMLRRMKSMALEGLPKIHHHYCEELMPKTQADFYKKVVDSAKDLSDEGRQLEALHQLRSISLHPHKYMPHIHDNTFISESARLRATFNVLDRIHQLNEKVLIFIEFREWHQADFLPAILMRRYKLNNAPMVISGAIKSSERQARVNKFQEEANEFDVMLLSPRAGGVGLTLTSANHVIHLSRWWNPAVEDQCTDRAYRKGQKKDVHVYYPMARHPELGDKSFDYCLKQLLDHRRHLSRSLLTPPVSKDDVNQLKKSVIFDAAMPRANSSEIISLNEINCMEPRQFEDWVASQCRKEGLIVYRPQQSWDGGADCIIKNSIGEIQAIVQCKHTQYSEASYAAISDLLRASNSYGAVNAKLIAVTNAPRFASAVQDMANHNQKILLISADKILQLGKYVRDNLI